MQVRQKAPKPKYKISDFSASGNSATNKVEYHPKSDSLKLFCICGKYSEKEERRCTRCKNSYHRCVITHSTSDKWQCPQCLTFYMDPIFSVRKCLLQTHFKTDSIFNYANMMIFHFELNEQDLKNPVEVRGLKDGKENLSWPMQGSFYLNQPQPKQSVFQLKPLLLNSNRKNRKQEAFIIPSQKLKEGQNTLIFHIPKLDPITFKAKYQHEEKNIYFIGIYSINRLSKNQLIKQTLQGSFINKKQSLKFLKELTNANDPQLSVEKIKMCLECPYMKSKIKIPIRGKECRHYTCLCLETLIQARVGIGSREWLCPICSSKINEPVADRFILDILNDGNPGTQIFLRTDGQYEWVPQSNVEDLDDSFEEKIKKQKQKEPEKQVEQKIDPKKVISLDDEDPIQIVEIRGSSTLSKQERVREEKEKNVLAMRQKRNKTKPQLLGFHPKNSQFMIHEVKQLQFKTVTVQQFTKKYFKIDYNRSKVPEELHMIFREVI